MLPNEPALEDVMMSGGGLDAMPAHSTWVQMGTIGVEATEQVAAEVARRRPDVNFVDAPVSGTRQPARTGRLIVYASGPDQARESLTPIFDALGERTLWLGQAGAAAIATNLSTEYCHRGLSLAMRTHRSPKTGCPGCPLRASNGRIQ